ncbi:MAG: hypothetical protein IJW16_05070 [Clostridia bacterium]|nr:hypothetical protein [Clostridia bacterium]
MLLKQENKTRKIYFSLGVLTVLYVALTIVWDVMRFDVLNAIGLLVPWLLILLPLILFALPLLLWARRAEREGGGAVKCTVWLLSALFLALTLSSVYTVYVQMWNYPPVLYTWSGIFGLLFSLVNLLRAAVLLPICTVLVAMLLYPVRDVLSTAFAKRWWIALGVFCLFVLCRINFSNVGAYNSYVQPGMGDSLIYPLFGNVRHIRSDEWLVTLPMTASSEYAGFGEINDILRGTANYNLPATGLWLSYAALSDPFYFGFFLLGTEMGVSFFWCATMLMSVMLSLEFAYIISDKSKLMAMLGVALIAMSPFNLWWSICSLLTGFMGVLVCAYYCFCVEKFYQKCLCMAGVALLGAFFICQLYPAWQVPMVYLLFAIFAWIIVDRFEAVRAFRAKEWIAAAVAVVFMASIVLAYLLGIQEYTKSIMGTVYPGERFDSGGYALPKIFTFVQGFQIPFRDITLGSNNSEAATFFSFFPIPMLLALYVLVRQIADRIKGRSREIDWFGALLLIPTLFLTVYCTVGVPAWLAKITLMSYSPAGRAADFLAFANVILLIRFVAKHKKYRLPAGVAAGAIALTLAVSFTYSEMICPGYLSSDYTVFMILLSFTFGMACFAKIPRGAAKGTVAVFAVLAILIGARVSPVGSGIGALNEKPAAQKIQSIVEQDPDAKWIGWGDLIVGQYAVANGAPCISSTNYVPNLELWRRLDPNGEYERVYNRYAHVVMEFTDGETSFELLTPDSMRVKLSYADIEKTEAKYIFALNPVKENSDVVDFLPLYEEGNAYIYEIVYK